ncbi:MAG: ribonuclease Y [Verrucomicrobiia bacterium]|jgi:ribonuclease Y
MRRFLLENAYQVLVLTQAVLWVMAGYWGHRIVNRWRLIAAQREARSLIENAERDAASIRRAAEVTVRGDAVTAREDFEKQTIVKRAELDEKEKRLIAREASLQEKLETLIRREEELRESDLKIAARLAELDRLKADVQALIQQQRDELHRLSGLSPDEARQQLLHRVELDTQAEAAALVRRSTQQARADAEHEAKRIVSIAIQRCAAHHVNETTTTSVPLPSEEMKGRIIGRDGRNIRAFEAATGVSLIIDETPQVVVLSGYEPVRREIARVALTQLVGDGRINPGRIEEVVQKAAADMDETVRQAGEDACARAGVQNVHPEIVKVLGRLKFRHSYAQNVLDHGVEVSQLVGAMAGELKLDVPLAKRIGLLHDIGKAVSAEIEGSHAIVGAELLRKYDEPPEVVAAIASHHEEAEPNIYGVLASAGDAISASRPGARSESAAVYLERLGKLEALANGFPGVERSYAIQAGREIRVIVEPGKVDDNTATLLARDIARKIERELRYPSQIKVTVMREMRVVEYAK